MLEKSKTIVCLVEGCKNELRDLPHNRCRTCEEPVCPEHAHYFAVYVDSYPYRTLKTLIMCPNCKPKTREKLKK
ncbi:MAG: hypothetical protein ACFFC7_17415 [Candidatus Hermodarchaeota archaeon]